MSKPPFTITSNILTLAMEISSLLGNYAAIKKTHLSELKLLRSNKVRSVHSSLAIEGNNLSLEQINAIIAKRKIDVNLQEVLEVKNAINAYNKIAEFKPNSSISLRKAHKLLMTGLTDTAGKWRNTDVGVFKQSKVVHMAPPAKLVPTLMRNLFLFMKQDKETSPLIKACVFHYELEFIHPFTDGNGRIGRLWQQVILSNYNKVFELIAVETLIKKYQNKYYAILEKCDKSGESTLFIEFILHCLLQSLRKIVL